LADSEVLGSVDLQGFQNLPEVNASATVRGPENNEVSEDSEQLQRNTLVIDVIFKKSWQKDISA